MRQSGDPLRISAADSRFVAPPVRFAADATVAALPPSALSSGGVRECSEGPASASGGEPVRAKGARGRDAVVSGIRQRSAAGARTDARGRPGRSGGRVPGGAAGSRPPDPGGGVAGRDRDLRSAGRPDPRPQAGARVHQPQSVLAGRPARPGRDGGRHPVDRAGGGRAADPARPRGPGAGVAAGGRGRVARRPVGRLPYLLQPVAGSTSGGTSGRRSSNQSTGPGRSGRAMWSTAT